jgi:predicted acylesterase/phospholipase RssA
MSDPSSAPSAGAPLGPIALSLSGGGYRAAAFHLGVLGFLDRVRLLDDVVGLSTVSGGSITGMAWVVSRIDGEPFDAFHRRYAEWMRSTNVIEDALDDLAGERGERRGSWPSLIRSAAGVYARDDLFGDRRFAEVLSDRAGLEEAIFNSTEFHTGIAFRFRASENPRAAIGNANYRVPRAVAGHVRLADIVAASSCFPGGFEPLVFPQHFRWPADFPLAKAREALGERYADGLPLMDGGIYDNQGVESLVLAFQRSSAATLLVSDVSVSDDQIYDVPPPALGRGWVTLRMVYWAGWALFAVALVAAFVLGWHGWDTARNGSWGWQEYFLYLVPGVLSAAVAGVLVYARRRLDDANELIESQLKVDAWPPLRRLTVPEFVSMLVLRAGSVLALTSSIFMKRIRGLVFRGVWQDARFDDRRIANLIHTLATPQPKLFEEHPWLAPKPHLVELSRAAQRVPTALWWDDDGQFPTLERAGQATLCFVLLRFIVRTRAGAYEAPGTPLHDLYTRLRGEWEVLNGTAVRMPVPEGAVATGG